MSWGELFRENTHLSEYKLASEIIKLSTARNWPAAKLEWKLEEVYESDELDACLCGHPIREICVIRNRVNGSTAVVGNSCVKKFLDLASDPIFRAVKRVRTDNTKSVNVETLVHALERNWINQWEFDFYKDIMYKRILTEKRQAIKLQINQKILSRIGRPVFVA